MFLRAGDQQAHRALDVLPPAARVGELRRRIGGCFRRARDHTDGDRKDPKDVRLHATRLTDADEGRWIPSSVAKKGRRFNLEHDWNTAVGRHAATTARDAATLGFHRCARGC